MPDVPGPKKVCFVVMPYGKRATGLTDSGVPKEVDFDRLWDEAYQPALQQLGYDPVRADMDLGALIIKEMLERLVIAHVVAADISIPNGNVYYEIGVRHAAKEQGCVLLAAEWAKPLFDIDQMPRLVYPLADGAVGEDAATAVHNLIVEKLPALVAGTSPVFQSVTGYPDTEPEAGESFKGFVRQLSQFQGKARATRGAAPSKRAGKARSLVEEVLGVGEVPPAVALELLYLLRDVVDWKETQAYIEKLPKQMQDLTIVQEQLALARSKAGDHDDAIAGLEALIQMAGGSSERYGLLGGRYKKLMRIAESEADRAHYLDKAIENYQLGTNLDLNDYYPSCNLARLYRTRGREGDEKLAQSAAAITLAAVHRSLRRDPSDEWIRPTLLGAAFDDGNVDEAKKLAAEIKRDGALPWKLTTTLDDLRTAIELLPKNETQDRLRTLHEDIEKLL